MKVALTTAVEEYNKVFGEKEYSIYRKPDGVLFAIKQQGFSWSAMFFSGLWCLLKGLYNELFILIGYQIVISIFAIQTEYELIGNFVRLLFHILFSIHLGLHGNKLYIKKCTSKYQLIKTVKAFSREDALLKVPLAW